MKTQQNFACITRLTLTSLVRVWGISKNCMYIGTIKKRVMVWVRINSD